MCVQDEFLGCMDKRMQAVLREAAAVAAHLASPNSSHAGKAAWLLHLLHLCAMSILHPVHVLA